jgi:hypothetical protein
MLRVVLAAVLLLAACGTSTDPSLTKPFEGTWAGDFAGDALTFATTLQLTQNGDAITGTLLFANGRRADLAATATGDTFDGSLDFSDNCFGSITATLNQAPMPNEITGDLSIYSCPNDDKGTFLLLAQN